MSSKASGEPTLLLSTSILYALRHAVLAAHAELQASEQPVNGLSTKKDAEGNNISGNDFFVLAAPATTIKLKQVRQCRHGTALCNFMLQCKQHHTGVLCCRHVETFQWLL